MSGIYLSLRARAKRGRSPAIKTSAGPPMIGGGNLIGRKDCLPVPALPAGRRQAGFVVAMLLLAMTSFTVNAFADVSIETSANRSRLAVGEELSLDIVVSNADGPISRPSFPSIEGFSSYSQGHSQEISIINGQKSSRSIFSYVLIANSVGKKTIGPFELTINGKAYKVAAVQVEVTSDRGAPQGPSGSTSFPQGPVVSPPQRALPGDNVSNQDIFVKAWLDKDEAYINEPVILTYTIYTRLSATYKGFEKEPVTTGFWVEDFPPEKTMKRTEQILGGSRYVVADVRKMALFPTQAGLFTIDPGVLSTTVEIRNRDDFDSFFSYNIFGRRGPYLPSSFVTQVFSKSVPTEKLTLLVKALPDIGKPPSFSGAVGDYRIESSIDKEEVQEGDPVTYRVRILGQGNINTLETPVLPKLEDFKVYDSSSSVNISKDRLVVEGEKITETVLVPKKAGTFTIPALKFGYFDPRSQSYKEIQTFTHTLHVKPGAESEHGLLLSETGGPVPVEKEEVRTVANDIRYIKTNEGKPLLVKGLYRSSLYWILNFAIFVLALCFMWLRARKETAPQDFKGMRLRRSHRVARQKLRTAAHLLKKDKHGEFYTEIAKALYGYFADKLDISVQRVDISSIESALGRVEAAPEISQEIKALFEELSLGRFGKVEKGHEDMKRLYEMADRVITLFEKVKLR